MAQTYWTLTYNGVEKTFAAWGLGKVRRRRKNIALSEITAVADGQPIDSLDLFAFQATCVIQRNRVGTEFGTSFSGGSVWHSLAIVTDSHRIGSPSSESVSYTFSNVFWYFQSIFFKPSQYRGIRCVDVSCRIDLKDLSDTYLFEALYKIIRNKPIDILDVEIEKDAVNLTMRLYGP